MPLPLRQAKTAITITIAIATSPPPTPAPMKTKDELPLLAAFASVDVGVLASDAAELTCGDVGGAAVVDRELLDVSDVCSGGCEDFIDDRYVGVRDREFVDGEGEEEKDVGAFEGISVEGELLEETAVVVTAVFIARVEETAVAAAEFVLD